MLARPGAHAGWAHCRDNARVPPAPGGLTLVVEKCFFGSGGLTLVLRKESVAPMRDGGVGYSLVGDRISCGSLLAAAVAVGAGAGAVLAWWLRGACGWRR